MRFLKPYIFYPNKDDETTYSKINEQWNKYNIHLKKNKDKIDKSLFELYQRTDRFHDYKILEIIYEFKDVNHMIVSVRMEDCYRKTEYRMTFNGVCSFQMKSEDFAELEDIVLCEIGITKGINYLSLYLISGHEIEICFKDMFFISSNV